MNSYQIIVVGGGAAGLMAAGKAAEQGASVLLLEKMRQPGLKLSITGKGRCNLTNVVPLEEFISHFGKNGRFLRQAFNNFFSRDLVDFFEARVVPTVTERGGRVFPASERAQDVVNALVKWAKQNGVVFRTQTPVTQLMVQNGAVTGIEAGGGVFKKTTAESKIPVGIGAQAIILATGGASYPATGSSGDGYSLASAVGHHIVPVSPALVPLETVGKVASRLQGLNLRNVKITLWINGKKRTDAFGEMLFTQFGLSGPIILSISKLAVSALSAQHNVSLSIDLKPALTEPQLDARLLRDFAQYNKHQFEKILKGLLPIKLIPLCIQQTGIVPTKVAHQITTNERKRLLKWLKNFSLEITGYRPFSEALITAGGIDLSEVDPRTMASRLVKGLYFAGEILDVDADTGGYNLQAAFSTGWLAGQATAQAV